jgi:hypothetical protein
MSTDEQPSATVHPMPGSRAWDSHIEQGGQIFHALLRNGSDADIAAGAFAELAVLLRTELWQRAFQLATINDALWRPALADRSLPDDGRAMLAGEAPGVRIAAAESVRDARLIAFLHSLIKQLIPHEDVIRDLARATTSRVEVNRAA